MNFIQSKTSMHTIVNEEMKKETYSVYLYPYFYVDLNEADQSSTYHPDIKYYPFNRNYFISDLFTGSFYL